MRNAFPPGCVGGSDDSTLMSRVETEREREVELERPDSWGGWSAEKQAQEEAWLRTPAGKQWKRESNAAMWSETGACLGNFLGIVVVVPVVLTLIGFVLALVFGPDAAAGPWDAVLTFFLGEG